MLCSSLLDSDDLDFDLTYSFHAATHHISPLDWTHACGGAGEDQVTGRQSKKPREVRNNLRDSPDHFIDIAILPCFAVHGEPDGTGIWMPDIIDGTNRGAGGRLLEGLADLPWTL